MISQALIVAVEEIFSKSMAVPKKRRSKAKGKTRLSNWKKKGEKAAAKAYNAAKTFFAKEKMASSIKNNEKLVGSSSSTIEETNN